MFVHNYATNYRLDKQTVTTFFSAPNNNSEFGYKGRLPLVGHAIHIAEIYAHSLQQPSIEMGEGECFYYARMIRIDSMMGQ